MSKYWGYFRQGIQNTLVYRGAMIFWLLGNIMAVATMVFVWLSADAGMLIGGYTKSELITYYVVSIFLAWIIAWYPFWIADDIKSGDIIGQILLKPVSLYWRAFMSDLAWHAISIFFGFVASGVIWFFLKNYFIFSMSLDKFVFILLAMVLAIFVVFGFCVVVSLAAFWLTETNGVIDVFWILLTIFGGQAYPLTFLPKGIFTTLSTVLPFRYMFSFPMEIYFEKLSTPQIFQGFSIGLFWVIFIAFAYKIVWKKGVKVYNAWGQ